MTPLLKMTFDDATTRSCNATCYNARTPTCTCICDGENHGVGLIRAAQNTIRNAARWLDDQKTAHPETCAICVKLSADLYAIALQARFPFDQPDTEQRTAE